MRPTCTVLAYNFEEMSQAMVKNRKMYMQSFTGGLAALILLCSCQQMREISYEVTDLGNDMTDFGKNVSAVIDGRHPRQEAMQTRAPDTRFCYKVQADILCYPQPLPGQNSRLVGYQAQGGGSTAAVPAPLERVEVKAIGTEAEASTVPVPRRAPLALIE